MPSAYPPEPACPICGSTATHEFLRRPSVPVHQNLLFQDAAVVDVMQMGRRKACA
jgi:hypothetical protein